MIWGNLLAFVCVFARIINHRCLGLFSVTGEKKLMNDVNRGGMKKMVGILGKGYLYFLLVVFH